MLQKVIPYEAIFITGLHSELGGQFLMDNDWAVAEAMQSFLKTFYLAAVSLSTVYKSTSMFHKIVNASAHVVYK